MEDGLNSQVPCEGVTRPLTRRVPGDPEQTNRYVTTGSVIQRAIVSVIGPQQAVEGERPLLDVMTPVFTNPPEELEVDDTIEVVTMTGAYSQSSSAWLSGFLTGAIISGITGVFVGGTLLLLALNPATSNAGGLHFHTTPALLRTAPVSRAVGLITMPSLGMPPLGEDEVVQSSEEARDAHVEDEVVHSSEEASDTHVGTASENEPEGGPISINEAESYVLPIAFEPGRANPEIFDDAIFSEFVRAMLDDQGLHFAILGYIDPRDGEISDREGRNLAYRRAVETSELIRARGPSRRRITARVARLDEPFPEGRAEPDSGRLLQGVVLRSRRPRR